MSEIHPSKDIFSSKSRVLQGKKVALGVCGSVACIRAPDIARELMRHGADVCVVMSQSAQKLISPQLMEWATGNPVVTVLTGKIEHVALSWGGEGSADAVLIVPATANTISKMAAGIDDTPVTSLATTAIGSGVAVVVAPAMHGSMYRHPIISENLKKLASIGVKILIPDVREGKAKLADDRIIVDAVISSLTPKEMQGMQALITSGPTRSYLDAIRYVTNSSSGKMGFALAREASARGAQVTVVSGPVDAPPLDCRMISITSTEEMLEVVLSELNSREYDLLVMAAAPLDFAVSKRLDGKISSDSSQTLKLTPLPKISKEARRASNRLFIIGFKAEYGLSADELQARARAKLNDSGMDLIVANDLSKPDRGFEAETNEVYIIDGEGLVAHVPLSPKREVARKVLDIYLERRQKWLDVHQLQR